MQFPNQPEPRLLTRKGDPVSVMPKTPRVYSQGHCYVCCELLTQPGRFEWIRKDHLHKVMI